MKAMKKNYWTLMACTAVIGSMALAGCSNEDDLTTGKATPDESGISISRITAGMPQGNPSTRLIYEDGTNGGLNVKWSADNIHPESFFAACYAIDGYNLDGLKFVQEVGSNEKPSTSTTFKSQRWDWDEKAFVDGNFKGYIQAIYPAKDDYQDGFEKSNAIFTAFNLPFDGQTGKRADMAQFDYMTAEGIVTTNETGDASLNLKFKHRVAVMRIKGLTFPPEVTGDVTGITLNGTNLSACMTGILMKSSFTLNAPIQESIATVGTFSIGQDHKLTEDVYICFPLMFNEDGLSTKEITGLTVSAKVNGVTYQYSYADDPSVTVPITKFVTGNMYTLSDKTMTVPLP